MRAIKNQTIYDGRRIYIPKEYVTKWGKVVEVEYKENEIIIRKKGK